MSIYCLIVLLAEWGQQTLTEHNPVVLQAKGINKGFNPVHSPLERERVSYLPVDLLALPNLFKTRRGVTVKCRAVGSRYGHSLIGHFNDSFRAHLTHISLHNFIFIPPKSINNVHRFVFLIGFFCIETSYRFLSRQTQRRTKPVCHPDKVKSSPLLFRYYVQGSLFIQFREGNIFKCKSLNLPVESCGLSFCCGFLCHKTPALLNDYSMPLLPTQCNYSSPCVHRICLFKRIGINCNAIQNRKAVISSAKNCFFLEKKKWVTSNNLN